jgi:hypothetical protein
MSVSQCELEKGNATTIVAIVIYGADSFLLDNPLSEVLLENWLAGQAGHP